MIKKHLSTFLYWLAFSLVIISVWLRTNFGTLSFEQVLYHLQVGIAGLGEADPDIFFSFALWCLLLPLCLTIAISFGSKFMSQRFNFVLLISCVVVCSTYFIYTFAIIEYLRRSTGEDYIANYYVEPTNIKLAAKPKNLILIYVESLENTYSNKKIFGEDLLASINQFPGTSFKHFKQIDGANWTIAAMVSTMCGIPLKEVYTYGTVLHVNDMGGAQREFLPNLTCLGDILQTHGYTNTYMGGAGLAFGAKGKFLRDHGYSEVIGRDELAQLGVTDFNKWGVYDHDLLQQAKLKVDALEQNGRPYNLTLLTLDTHTPYGYISPHCKAKLATTYKDVIKCSSQSLADFVWYLQTQGYLQRTQVVILGDHLVMSGQVISEDLNQDGERMVYNKFILSEPLRKNRDEIVHLDMFPTLLNILGFSIVDNKLGLGVSGFGAAQLEPDIYNEIHHNLMGLSAKYYSFWK